MRSTTGACRRLAGVDRHGENRDEGEQGDERFRDCGEKPVASEKNDQNGGRHDGCTGGGHGKRREDEEDDGRAEGAAGGDASDAAEDFKCPEQTDVAFAEPSVAGDQTFSGIDRVGGSGQEERILQKIDGENEPGQRPSVERACLSRGNEVGAADGGGSPENAGTE
ncbi:MAG: hypothetical protein J6K46_08345 [Sutterella sp.]|nr:hypothetical protein [Sutterella sp.]